MEAVQPAATATATEAGAAAGRHPVTLLIDGDGEAYKAACVSQEVIDWDDTGNQSTVELNQDGAEDYLVSALSHYQERLDAYRIIVCLSDEDNWRKKLWPDYKANRKDIARPLLLEHCKKFLADSYEVECWPRLEADDVMGLLSQTITGSIIVSVDKDMKTVPCRLYRPNRPDEGVVDISPNEAFRNHMIQALMGDAVDGFKGCPGIGPKKAAKIVDGILSEPNFERRSVADAMLDFMHERKAVWESVTNQYLAKGLTEEDSLLNARLAYILHQPGDYNRKTAKLRLWQAPT